MVEYSFEDDDVGKQCLSDFNLNEILKKLNKFSEIEKINFSIYFVSKKTISNLNGKYRNKFYPTDVLSFGINSVEENYIGEIIVCCDKIKERAIIEKDSNDNTLLYMILHSYLHLLGLTHDNEDEYEIFERKTEELIKRVKEL